MPSWGGAQNVRDQLGYQQQRYENQQGPMADAMAFNYGRGTEADYGNYTDIMNNYRDIYSGGGQSGGGGGGGGGEFSGAGMYTPFTVSPGRAGYTDPFKSYGGYEEFSKTGGYSKEDVSNMRARSVSPIRAAYGNAEREMGRQRSLQGGYSPNAFASQAKMAREQGQLAADAMQNTEAGLAQMKQQGRLSGLGGMSNIEGQRLGADVDISKFNTGLDFQGQTYNADAQSQAQARNIAAAESAASRSAASAAASMNDRFKALGGAASLYGTTPGMSNMFGSQLINAVGQGGNMGMGYINAQQNAEQMPGNWDIGMSRVGQVGNMIGTAGDMYDRFKGSGQQQPAPTNTWGYGGWGGGFNPNDFPNAGSTNPNTDIFGRPKQPNYSSPTYGAGG